MVRNTKRGPNFARFILLSIGAVLIKKTPRTLGDKMTKLFMGLISIFKRIPMH
jgi:hypothetical protein